MDESFNNKPGLSLAEQNALADQVEDILAGESKQEREAKNVPTIAVSEARKTDRMLEVTRERSRTRVLFVADKAEYLDTSSVEYTALGELTEVFDEVHCLVVLNGRREASSSRPAEGMFLHQVHGAYRWTQVHAARALAREQLVFGGAARPDCIVALSPFMAGTVAVSLSRMMSRPVQLHLSFDPFDVRWLNSDPKNKRLKNMANRNLAKIKSVRTQTEHLMKQVEIRFKKTTDISLLPHYYNYSAYSKGVAQYDVHERYLDYSFIILTQSVYTADSSLHDTITALIPVLRNPSIGLVVVGSGGAKELFVEKAKILRLDKNIVFLSEPVDTVSLYTSADMCVISDTSVASEEWVLRAVSAKLPLCLYQTALREDLFVTDESALLVEERDSFALGKAASRLVNNPSLRTRFASRMEDIVAYRLHEDRGAYLEAFRNGVEEVLSSGNDTKATQ